MHHRLVAAAVALLLACSSALAILSLPNETQNAVNDILAAVSRVENPTARQRIDQKRVQRSTRKLFREGRSLRQCLADIRRVMKRVGPSLDDAELADQTVRRLRVELLRSLNEDVLGAVLDASRSLRGALSESTPDRLARKIENPLRKAAEILEVSTLTSLQESELDARELTQLIKGMERAVGKVEAAARRARKKGLVDVPIVVPDNG